MKLRRLMMVAPVILWSTLVVAVPVAAVEEPEPARGPVRQAIEKGKKLLEDGKIDEAREKFDEARVASNNQAPAAFVGLAEVELKLDNLERSLQYVDKALELVRDPVSKAEILNLKGIIVFGYVRKPMPTAADRLCARGSRPGLQAAAPCGG